MNDDFVDKVKDLAYHWHEGQFRKGPDHLPYITHPAAVVSILKSWHVSDPVTLAIAWGHDLLEDTAIPESEISAVSDEHGNAILSGIKSLTHVPGTPKRDYIASIANSAPANILAIKLADRIHNTSCFIHDGDYEYAAEYFSLATPLITNLHRLDDHIHPYAADSVTGILSLLHR